MMRVWVAVLLTWAWAAGFSVDVLPGTKECYVAKAAQGMPVTGSFEVIHPDANHIAVTVVGPSGYVHYEKRHGRKLPPPKAATDKEEEAVTPEEGDDEGEDAAEGFFSFDAEIAGDYKMCIANGEDDNNDGVLRLVAFNFRAKTEGDGDYQFVGLQSELADLKEGLELLRDHQSYMNQREDVHKESLESINIKVLCWTILESVILIAMAFWQISYIRSFFEIKRKI